MNPGFRSVREGKDEGGEDDPEVTAVPSSTGGTQGAKSLTNFLLDSLPPVERTPLLDRGDVVSLDGEHVLYEPGEAMDHVLFPCPASSHF
jgi:hypothetical protein